jgi:hypothetical protein
MGEVTSLGGGVAVGVASAGVGTVVGVGGRTVGREVVVAVAVKVGRGVAVGAGGAVETPAKRSKLVRRQACKKASKPSQPAPLINFLRFILLGE